MKWKKWMKMETNKIDAILSEYEVLGVQIQALQKKKDELEAMIYMELDSRSSDTNWATVLKGKDYEAKRSSKSSIDVDDLRYIAEEWMDDEELDRCIRKARTRIVEEPERVMMTEVKKLKKQGGELADYIEKMTKRVSSGIKIKRINNGQD
tara:strand:- start:1009 stop:1461 length:453 start_codon:yes stop_codon:yes gene_type:complete